MVRIPAVTQKDRVFLREAAETHLDFRVLVEMPPLERLLQQILSFTFKGVIESETTRREGRAPLPVGIVRRLKDADGCRFGEILRKDVFQLGFRRGPAVRGRVPDLVDDLSIGRRAGAEQKT